MKVTLDCNQRVFLISRSGLSTRDYFCNLADIPTIIKTQLETHDEFTISEYWNKKFKRCSRKHINEMLKAAKIDYQVK